MSELLQKLMELSQGERCNRSEVITYRRENKYWLDKSRAIALLVLTAIRQQRLTKKQLAVRMNISVRRLNKIVRGGDNMTLEIMGKLEKELGIEIINATSLDTQTDEREREWRKAS